ncbi:GDYXXLXY domain-containing protein [Rhizobiaceae bacterium BDR2-2]|uniref:GDYXXLXY domain-containing protein n=1 Tax=Ectorhizobium quercum TaxID=2965071 RepID=A0AAE3SVE6_9HYPH|nr:GDYXXLXY domain-containing protein [Ectorhizobium quercum]MCX8997583.1 GDYXXLXY domain-containing protein [Ectorhizobium quercum]
MSRFLIPAAVFVALLQSAVLFHVVASRAAVLRDGTEIRLETAPVDPRDLLRGDYVTLNYTIGRVMSASIVGPWPAERGRHTIYVRLVPGAGGFWSVSEASFQPLAAQEGSVVLKGIAGRVGSRPPGGFILASYGIERYYVPEGEGKAIENARNDGRISVAARVSKDGVARIRALLQDGEPLYEEPLY